MQTRFMLCLSCALAIGACTLSGDYVRPVLAVPAEWSEPAGVGAGPASDRAPFWEAFGSDDLDRSVETALERNQDLGAALQRVEQARAQSKVSAAPLLPAADASGNASRLRQDSGRSESWQGVGALNYELDLFGKNRSLSSAAQNRARASEFDRQSLQLVVTSDTTRFYCHVLAFNDRLRIADKNLRDAQSVLRIIEARHSAGAVSALEVAQQRLAVNSLRAALAELTSQRAAAIHALAVLLGEMPQGFAGPSGGLAELRIPDVDLTPPVSLLSEGRPDLQSAEAQLRAAHADVGAARAAFFPSLKLGTNASLAASSLTNPTSLALSMASNALAPVFSGGRLRGNLQNVSARQRELAAHYQQMVLTAFSEVEDALAALRSSRERSELSVQSVREAQQAYRISKARFDAGSIDYLTLLETERSLAQAEDSEVVATQVQIDAVVNLHKALGS